MKNRKLIRCGLALFTAAALMCAILPAAAAESASKYIIINGNSAETTENRLFRGIGAVSSGASLRLLADYKSSSPDEYYELLNILFSKENGAALSQLFVEMGSDINSVPCAEPAAMSSADDIPDITGNAGWQIAADAMKIAPDISVGMIRTEEPRFVADAFAESRALGLETCYKWYKACIEAVYDTYGIRLSYISANSSDDDKLDAEQIIYLSEQLKNETDCRYDYSSIKIGVTVSSGEAAEELAKNESLCLTADVIDCRSMSEEAALLQKLSRKYGMELYALGCGSLTSISDPSADNSPLDFVEKIIDLYCSYGITLAATDPPAVAVYSGTKYYPEGFVTADTPWSGHYTINPGLWAAEHFTRFSDDGWQFIQSGCQSDSCLTLTDTASGDYSVIVVNNSPEERLFRFSAADIGKYSSDLNVWLSDFAEGSFMQNKGTISPEAANGSSMFEYTLPPYSLATLTTTNASPEYSEYCSADDVRLMLPYSDDFGYPEKELSERGRLPMYINVLGGTFEVWDGRLVQTVSDTAKPIDSPFSSTPAPAAVIGDDSWADYSLSASVRLASASDSNYAGIGIRCGNYVDNGAFSGYGLLINGSGKWSLLKENEIMAEGEIKNFSPAKEYKLTVEATGPSISAAIDGEEIFSAEEEGSFSGSGRLALYSAYCGNSFDDLSVLPTSDCPYVTRIDSAEDGISYFGGFSHDYPFYTYHGHSRSSCDTGSGVYSGSEPFTGSGFVYTGFSESENGKMSRILYDGSSALYVYGSFTNALKVSLDGSEISLTAQSGRIVIPPVSGRGMHTVLISDSSAAEIEYICTSAPAENGGLSFGFTGTGFALTGENAHSALIDVYIDGELYEENIVTLAASSKQCFYSCTGLDYSAHTAEIRVKGGKFSLDAVEYFTKTKLISESDNPKAYFPPPVYETTAETVTETAPAEIISEIPASDEAAGKSDSSRGIRFVIIFLISAAAGVIVYFITPKDTK